VLLHLQRKEAKEGLERASERAKLLEEQQAQAAAQIRELEEREEEEAQKREALLVGGWCCQVPLRK
jgi:hypothetical protein